ncbi:MAG TPA: RelA/SpoT family protein [Gammaproteobacteria bacterium]|nr:RelA/SpoT family protein [Gammaproteobacteria bacterium]
MRLFKKLQQKLDYLPKEAVDKIFQAYVLAADAHKDQSRFSGEPYITHPLAVACILADMRMDPETLMAALLHDVIEDTPTTKDMLAKQFGDSVAELVDGVSKLTLIEFRNRQEAQAENFQKMILAMSRDIRVMIIKLADRLHNMRTLVSLTPEKRRRIARETLEIFAPIANRLGMHAIFVELENLGFEALHPQRFRILKSAVQRILGDQKKIMHEVDRMLREAISRSQLPHCEVIGRQKNLYSIYQKMLQRKISFKDINDVYGFRIITDSVDACYRALGVVHSLYKPLPERFKDYIAIPKANGYQSLHTTLFGPFGMPIEVQIRTRAMNQVAESGIAAHWLYKLDEKNHDDARIRAQQWVKNLLEMQQKTGSSLEFIENVKIDLFPDEVYVFTPRGSIMELPKGATIIDFAYAVHTDVGNTCVAGKIDRQLAPLSTVLASGQTVEIIVTATAQPNPAWLDFAVTARARSAIRHYLKTERRRESVALGKELLSRALERLSFSIKKIPTRAAQAVVQEAQVETFDDLLEQIGLGNRLAVLVAHQLAIAASGAKEAELITLAESKPLLIKGTEGVVVHFATCCYPIPGDPIVGVLSAGHGLIIHVEQCKRIVKLRQQPDKCMAVSWAPFVEGEFIACIKVTGINQRGALARLAQAIADADANIDDITVLERDARHYVNQFKLHVRDRGHLAQTIRNLRRVKNVIKVARK